MLVLICKDRLCMPRTWLAPTFEIETASRPAPMRPTELGRREYEKKRLKVLSPVESHFAMIYA